MVSSTDPSESTDGRSFRRETCTVKRWRGYRTHSFYAELETGEPIAESKAFRERGRAEEPSPAAEQRHEELLNALTALGWERTDETGPAWYAITLQRPLAILETEAVVPAPEQPTPEPETTARKVVSRPVPRAVSQEPSQARGPASEVVAPSPPAPRPRRVGLKTAGATAAIALAGTAASVVLVTSSPSRAQAPAAAGKKATPSRTVPKHPTSSAELPAANATPVKRMVHVTIAAPARPSWLEIRRSSAHGRVLFSGELAAGHRLTLTGTRLWARFGAAGNLAISVDGKPLTLQGTYEHVFSAAARAY